MGTSSNAFRLVTAAALLAGYAGAHAQTATLNELRAKVFDARMAVKTFVNGAHHCDELNGSNFFFEPRNRVLGLHEFRQSLDNLVAAQTFNPERHRPWNTQDAELRWQQVNKLATEEVRICKMIAALPELEHQLAEIETKAADRVQDKIQDVTPTTQQGGADRAAGQPAKN